MDDSHYCNHSLGNNNVDPYTYKVGRGAPESQPPYKHLTVFNRLLAVALEGGLPNLLDEVPAATALTLGLDYSEVLELLPNGETLLLRSAVGWNKDLVGRLTVQTEPGSTIASALRDGSVVVAAHFQQQAGFGSTSLQAPGIMCGISADLGQGPYPFGLLGVHSLRPRIFAPEEVSFVQNVAGLLGRTAKTTTVATTASHSTKPAPPAAGHDTAVPGPADGGGIRNNRLTKRTSMILATPKAARDLHITPRQYETLLHLASGKDDHEIAGIYSAAVSTVRTHIQRLREAFDTSSKEEVIRQARLMGIVPGKS